ncbi:hypothetical protein FN846DRAFT_912455 [Sphaerosporella brunnea]|uniref:Uncharacterized protein n=1 Tax=Sphaerosporella brunnea TaxID=1250544 RepID=A0A5J5EHC4_9PEZI|nr:hypothetical protein FN846DRAFT_912455 [Sphaerosporella brunnea]
MSVKHFRMIIHGADQTRALRNQAAHSISPQDVCLAILYSPSQVRRDLMALRFKQFWRVTPERYEALPEADNQLKRAHQMVNAAVRRSPPGTSEWGGGALAMHQRETLEGEADNDKDLDSKDDQGKHHHEADVDPKGAD